MELTGLEKITRKVFDDPELFEIYEQARQQGKREEPEPLPKLDALERWTRILELREQWKTIFWEWPKDREPKDVAIQLRTIKAEEWRLLAEIQGERKTDGVAASAWLSQKVGEMIGYCTGCQKEREYTVELAARMLKRGLPKCKCNDQKIRLRTK